MSYLSNELLKSINGSTALIIAGTGLSIEASNKAPTASWRGLLRHGAKRCFDLYGSDSREWYQRIKTEIDSADGLDLLSAATKIASKLGGSDGGEFRVWLSEAVGQLELQEPSTLEALLALDCKIATTNYDSLLEKASGLEPILWNEHSKVEEFLRGDRQGILHIHGHWETPRSIIFDFPSYEKIKTDNHFQTMLKSFRVSHSLVFIGYGDGLDDPNFSAFRRWSASIFSESNYRNFRLATNRDVEKLEKGIEEDERLFILPFGPTHAHLKGFLRGLKPSKKPKVTLRKKSKNKPKRKRLARIKTNLAVGREKEIHEIQALLDENPSSVIAITGPSGFGKTLIARQLVSNKTGIEAYIDASTVSDIKSLAKLLTGLFPQQAWEILIELGGHQVDQLTSEKLLIFLCRLVSTANCSFVVDHAENWLEEPLDNDLHNLIAVLVRQNPQIYFILTTTSAPERHLKYRVIRYPLGPTDGAKGIAILKRYINAPDHILRFITRRFQGHPYALDLISRRLVGSYNTKEEINLLKNTINTLPEKINSLLNDYIDKLSEKEKTVLLGLAEFQKPMPSQWLNSKITSSLFEKGFLTYQVDLNSENAGWVVHPLSLEVIKLNNKYQKAALQSLASVLDRSVESNWHSASLPLARAVFTMGDYQRAFSITNNYWRFWCESSGINEGLDFIDSLLRAERFQDHELSTLKLASGVLRLYKGDRENLALAKSIFTQVKTASIAKGDRLLSLASTAELMEVIRRTSGISDSIELFDDLLEKAQEQTSPKESSYLLGLVDFLVGHMVRYAENYPAAIEYYLSASINFNSCASLNCFLEARHTAYALGMSHLKTGRISDAATIVESAILPKDSKLTFIGGLLSYLQSAVALAENDGERAVNLIKDSIDSFKRFQSYGYGARAELFLGWIFLVSGNYEESRRIFESVLARTFLSKPLVGRAECGLALSQGQVMDERKAALFRDGINKLGQEGDLIGSLGILARALRTGNGRVQISGIAILWAEVNESKLSLKKKNFDSISLNDLYSELLTIRPQSREDLLDAFGFA